MSEQRTPSEILAELGKPFPRQAIKHRQGGGGKSLAYIETHSVINRLNGATNGEWSFFVKNTEWRNDLLMVLGELTIPGLGTRSGFGVQKVVERAGEDLVKGAISDSLKKCATLFGVAIDLYGPDYEANATPQATQQAPQQPRSAAQPAPQAQTLPPANLDRERVMKRLHAVGNEHGIDHEGLRRIVAAKAAASGLSITSLTDAPGTLLAEAADAIERDPGKIKAWDAKQQELLPGTDAVPNQRTAESFTK